MPDYDEIPSPDLSLAELPAEAWRAELARLGEAQGHYEPIGREHAALFSDNGRDLLITFSSFDAARSAPGALPFGYRLAARAGWSHLAILAEGETWYRDPRLWGYFDRICDDGFLEDFDRVLFYGAHAGGHAAAAYSLAAPGARVLAVRPVATLTPGVAGWDRRHVSARRLDFTSRYGFAPDMIEAARRAYILHDPLLGADAAHAALFRCEAALPLRARYAGAGLEATLLRLGILEPMIEEAMAGTLTQASFARLWRVRRSDPSWLRALSRRLEAPAHRRRLAALARHGVTTRDAGYYKRVLEDLTAHEAA
ncbi:hypothetical protein [Pseudoroseicyclus tamaricis]|uniref:Phosphoadenosine phosphosulfate reductase n=1 Tax=Pseudoroseicyclus tamaricis TaxID=2705421 RepID=A0A6B2JRW9_9RHOB|nr:hypothetical protein [Pseudoroseicyclus tamaricis]NDV00730.1 hypothetical protein [Pseudoroseicyclus tamaricis]